MFYNYANFPEIKAAIRKKIYRMKKQKKNYYYLSNTPFINSIIKSEK